MTTLTFDARSMNAGTPVQGLYTTAGSAAMSRPQVGIDRLPPRRMSNEPRESMNCKSCRKRKIKCNRLRPACEACQVFQCACIYDAVPKKRGPKTDLLESLMKRVAGLEQLLQDRQVSGYSTTTRGPDGTATSVGTPSDQNPKRLTVDADGASAECAVYSPTTISEPPTPVFQVDALLDTYFSRFHAKPFHIFDESTVRQRFQLDQLPGFLIHAFHAIAARWTPHPCGYQAAVRVGEDHASQAKSLIDTDNASVDALQAMLLLVIAFTAAGKGKKAHMLMSNAVGMAVALELHREADPNARITPVEREMRRRLFWTCYLLDRFVPCGSRRPSLLGDRTVLLRLPCWSPSPVALPIEGEFFRSGSNLQSTPGNETKPQGSSGMLIDATRILGLTNQYLAEGGLRGDVDYPWKPHSNLFKIRQQLNVWALGTEELFATIDSLFTQPDPTVVVLSKLIYHLAHVLLYRLSLPLDMAEISGTKQEVMWQIEASKMCFQHANAITELIDMGKQRAAIEWPALVGYCISTAGTVHVHGVQYHKNGADAFSTSAGFLSRAMQQLSELCYAWASVQHQRETLQGVYNAHAELAKSTVGGNGRRPCPFEFDDFFQRYSGVGGPGGATFKFDAANLTLSDVIVDFTADTYTGHDLYAPRLNENAGAGALNRKRKSTGEITMESKRRAMRAASSAGLSAGYSPPFLAMTTSASSSHLRHDPVSAATLPSPPDLYSPDSHAEHEQEHTMTHWRNAAEDAAAVAAAASGFFFEPQPAHSIPALTPSPLSPPYTYPAFFSNGGGANGAYAPESNGGVHVAFDPMFGTMGTNVYSSSPTWHGDAGGDGNQMLMAPRSGSTSRHVGGGADVGAGVGPGEQRESSSPFLLEQMEQNGQGHELDFFNAGMPC